MIISRSQAKKHFDQIASASKSDSWTASLSGNDRRHLRFALNNVTTAGQQDDLDLSITSHFGKRSGTARTNELSESAILAAVRKSEQIARLAPENPEFMPP